MKRTLVVTYISKLTDLAPSEQLSPFALDFRSALHANEWPLDVGDDPSFFSAQRLGGSVTWGICRQDVRNHLQTGDAVVFFAVKFDRTRQTAEYRLSAALTVQGLISSDQVFRDPKLEIFSQYLNLLIRPSKNGWEHFEPGLPRLSWHDDWLWRICEHGGLRKSVFVEFGKSDSCPIVPIVNTTVVQFARNYIIFSPDPSSSVVFTQPPLVAHWSKPALQEEWLDTPIARHVGSLIFGNTNRTNLRTQNRQQPHRHFWLDDSPIPSGIVQALTLVYRPSNEPNR
jgi:hypothetical protein